jgi:hypothetical protein
MIDIASYSPPISFLGALANSIFISSQLESIFNYLENEIEILFPDFNE